MEIVREHQQAVTEEFEAANEELKSANEEILASNEELQSTNEELLTAKEELQSTNEELRIFNEEQGFRNRELEQLNTDLRGLLAGANVPIVVIARDLRIRRLTAQAETAFGLAGGDVGRPLRETSLGIVVPELAGAVARVIDSLQTAEFEAVAQDGQYYSFRVRPYELEDFRIDGVVVTAMNMSAIKAAEADGFIHKPFRPGAIVQALKSLGVLDD